MNKLTGNIRYRLQKRAIFQTIQLVLEVEEIVESVDVCPYTCDSHTFRNVRWRDATVTDMQELGTLTVQPPSKGITNGKV